MIFAGAVRLVSGILTTVNQARRFVFYWNSAVTIILTLLVQGLFLWNIDLTTVRSVLWFGVASALVSLLVNIVCTLYGFAHGPRKLTGLDHHPEVI